MSRAPQPLIEAEIGRLAEAAGDSPESARHFLSLRFYLSDVIADARALTRSPGTLLGTVYRRDDTPTPCSQSKREDDLTETRNAESAVQSEDPRDASD
jgi:hypothetical protein